MLVRAAWKPALGLAILALLISTRSVSQTQAIPHVAGRNAAATSIPCTPLPPGITTWDNSGGSIILPTNDKLIDPNACVGGIPVPSGSTLVLDATNGSVQIFSHGAGISVQGGELLTKGTDKTHTVSFDAEPDVASWDGIKITADANRKGDAFLSYVSIQKALTAISIDSGATSSSDDPNYGLTVQNSGIGPSYFDGIDARNTPISVTGLADGQFGTLNNIGSQGLNVTFDTTPALTRNALEVKGMTFGSSVPFDQSTCPPAPNSCVVTGSIGNNAIVATFVAHQTLPVVVDGNSFFRAGSFGIDLENANHPQITNNTFDCNGSGNAKPVVSCVGTLPRFSAVYLNNVTADLLLGQPISGIGNNKGQQNGLDAIVVNGTITSDLTWKTPTNDPNPPSLGDPPHDLGYMVANGDLNLVNSTKLTVGSADVVKVKGGSITLTGGRLDAHSTNGLAVKTFTSLRDKSIGLDACGSVFAAGCPVPLPAGEWGGIDLVGAGANGSIANAQILYATKGVQIANGASSTIASPTFGLVISNSHIGPSFSDSVSALGTPIALVGNHFDCPAGACTGPSAGDHGVLVDFTGSTSPVGGGLLIDSNTFTGSVNEAIRGVALSSQTVVITSNAVQAAGAFGIKLEAAKNPTLTGNTVNNSGTGSLTYSAVYLPDVTLADFNSAISGNTGSGNGLDAIAFHGTTGQPLAWKTIGASSALGYLVDGNLTVNGAFTLATGDYAPVLGGSITVTAGAITANGAVLTSLKEQAPHIASCGSVFVPKVSGVCPAKAAGDWGGLILDPGTANSLTDSEIRYATTGIMMAKPPVTPAPIHLVLTRSNVRNGAADGISTKSPLSVSHGAFTNLAGHGISVDLSNAGTAAALTVDQATISGTGAEGLLATGLAGGRVVSITGVSVDHAGAYGINLQAADHLTLTNNRVTNSAAGYAAIYLNGFTGPFANISGNTGAGNGLDALAFHGTVTDDLIWQTARQTSDATKLLGYLLDGGLNMKNHTLTVNAGDIVKVGNGGTLNLQGVSLKADDAGSSSQKIFTSLTDNSAGVPACPSALLPGCGPAVVGDWGGINLWDAGANGALVNGAVRYAATGISITSGATSTYGSSSFGLVVSRSLLGPTKADGIASSKTAISVTNSTITGAVHGVSVDLTGASGLSALRLSGNRFMSTSAEAILGQALGGQPVWITDNHVQGAGTFGIRLLGANELVLRDNNVSAGGGGPAAGSSRYPAIYLNAVSADFARNVRGNVGGGNGLDAIAFDGTVSGNLTWITPSNNVATHSLGYLLDGGLTLTGGTLTVNTGDVVKSLGGPITIKGGAVNAAGAATPASSLTSKSAIFTSLRDNPAGVSLNPVDASDAAAVSCPSVLASSCTPGPGDWGGLVITSNAAALKGSGAISYGLINYANTGISLDSGPISASPELSNFRLTIGNTLISNTSKDGINSLDTPFSVDSSTIQSAGANGIIGSFFSPANCSSTPGTCVRLNVTNTRVTGTGQDGIIANGLAEQPIVVSGNTVTNAGTYGIRLVGADQITLANNTVNTSGIASNPYPAIYLNNVSGDFNTAITGNLGAGNGIDALIFHGVANNGLTWVTPTPTPIVPPAPTPPPALGFMLDGALTVNGDMTTTGVVKVLTGAITVNGLLHSTNTVFTSMKEALAPSSCPSVLVAVCTPGRAEWGGINVNHVGTSHFEGGAIRYASNGLTISAGELDVSGALITSVGGYAVHTAGSGNAVITCAGIHGNGGGLFSEGAAGTSIADSNLFSNSSAGIDLKASVDTTATNVWWGNYPPLASQHSATHVTINNALTQERPSVKVSGGQIDLSSDNTNVNGKFGKGTLTVTLTFDRGMTLTTPLLVSFANPLDGVVHNVIGDWTHTDNVTWVGHAVIDGTLVTGQAGLNTLTISQGTSCVPDGNNVMNSETQDFTLDFTDATVDDSAGANHIGATSATVNGQVNPHGWSQPSSNPNTETYAFVESAAAGTALPDPATVIAGTPNPSTLFGYTLVGHGSSPVNISQTITGLLPYQMYHYEIIAVDLNGITVGVDQPFTTADVASKLIVTGGSSTKAGDAYNFTVTAEDSLNNVVQDYTGTVHFALQQVDIGATLPSDYTFKAFSTPNTAGDDGTHAFQVTLTKALNQTILANDTATPSIAGSLAVTVNPAGASKLVIGQQPTDTVAGQSITPAVTVKVQDQYGNVETGDAGTEHPVTVGLKSGGPAGTLLGTLTRNDVAGVATFDDLKIQTANNGFVLEATASGLTLTDSSSFNITPAAAVKLAFTTPPSGSTGGIAFGTQPVVAVEDTFGNLETGDNASTVTLSINAGTGDSSGILTCAANPTTVSGGNASFSGCAIDKISPSLSPYTLHAVSSLGGVPAADSGSVVITLGPAAKLVVTTQPSDSTGGIAFGTQPVVSVEDAGGNLETGDSTSTVSLGINAGTGDGAGTLTCTANPQTVNGGRATFAGCAIDKISPSLNAYTLHALSSLSGVAATDSGLVAITLGPAAQLAFTTQPAGAAANTAFTTQPVVSVEDAGGNVETTDGTTVVTLSITPGTGDSTAALTCSPASNQQTAVNGNAGFTGCAIDKASASQYRLRAPSSPSLTQPDSSPFTNLGAAAKLAFTTPPSGSTGGVAFGTQPVVAVEDAFGNLETGDSASTVTLSINVGTGDSSGVLTCAANPTTVSGGNASFSGCAIDKISPSLNAYTLHAVSSLGGVTAADSGSVVITLGPATQLVFSIQPSSTATAGSPFAQQPVVSVEDAGGNVVATDNTTSVTLGFTGGDSTATLTCTPNPATVSNGVATFAGCSISKGSVTPYQLTVSGTNPTLGIVSSPNVTVS